ncbi:MAG: DNA repair protein RecO [Kiritimatiellia bacterium]
MPLRIAPFSRTSHMVTWLTAERGIVTTSVKGALRSKSRFVGQYDLFYTCEIVVYQDRLKEVNPLRECVPIRLREGLRSDWRAVCAASYLCDLTLTVLQPEQANPTIFALLESTLDALESTPRRPLSVVLLDYELHLLLDLGLLPKLDGNGVLQGAAWPNFSYLHGCFLEQEEPGSVRLPRQVAEDFIRLTGRLWTGLSSDFPESQSAVQPIVRLVGMILRAQLELPLLSRRICLELIGGH